MSKDGNEACRTLVEGTVTRKQTGIMDLFREIGVVGMLSLLDLRLHLLSLPLDLGAEWRLCIRGNVHLDIFPWNSDRVQNKAAEGTNEANGPTLIA